MDEDEKICNNLLQLKTALVRTAIKSDILILFIYKNNDKKCK